MAANQDTDDSDTDTSRFNIFDCDKIIEEDDEDEDSCNEDDFEISKD